MDITPLHSWDVSTAQAREIQQQLRNRVSLHSPADWRKIRCIAAADVSFNRHGKFLYGAVVLFSFPELKLQDVFLKKSEAGFPYVPGYLSFREAPVVLDMFASMKQKPELLLCDGQGIAHPRGLGLASHLGLFLDMPSVGCAKSLLVGDYREPGLQKGNKSVLFLKERQVGYVLRTRSGVKPVFISPGHKISPEDAVEIAFACSPRYRIPEPLRVAHQKVNDFRRMDGG